jgi:uncharacterized RDD family membrane protein YckC
VTASTAAPKPGARSDEAARRLAAAGSLPAPAPVLVAAGRSEDARLHNVALLHRRHAGMASRGLSFILDLIIVVATATIVYYLTEATLALFRIDIDTCNQFMPWGSTEALVNNLCRIIRGTISFVSIMVAPVYLVVSWMLTGQTIGMAVAGLRVVRTDGRPLRLRHALLRLIGLGISLLVLGIGLLWSAIDRNRQGWHDKLGNTYVIYWRRTVAYKEIYGHQPAGAGAASEKLTPAAGKGNRPDPGASQPG